MKPVLPVSRFGIGLSWVRLHFPIVEFLSARRILQDSIVIRTCVQTIWNANMAVRQCHGGWVDHTSAGRYLHEKPNQLTRDEEHKVLLHAIENAVKATRFIPTGMRGVHRARGPQHRYALA